jgi:hypothetical protein
MKHIQMLVFMTLCGVVLMFANNVSAQSTKQGTATVVRIQGEARYSMGDNIWHPLIGGKILGAGAVIQTAVDSTVDLVLGEVPIQVAYPNTAFPTLAFPSRAADPNVRGYVVYNAKVRQNVIRMYGNTVLAIDKLNISDTGADLVGDTELDLRAGKIFGNVKKLSAMSQFEVKIPNGIAGIRGTIFTIEANGDVVVVGNNGMVLVSFGGQVYQVTSGETFNPTTGAVTGPKGQTVSVQPATPDELASVTDTYADTCTLPTGTSTAYDTSGLVEVFVSPVCGIR